MRFTKREEAPHCKSHLIFREKTQSALQDQSWSASDLVQYLLDMGKTSHQERTTRENIGKKGTQFQKALVYF